jgi:hypothetical protein
MIRCIMNEFIVPCVPKIKDISFDSTRQELSSDISFIMNGLIYESEDTLKPFRVM